MEHFRGVVWPRNDVKDKKYYRYVVIGMLVTEQPLNKFEGQGTIVLDGYAAGIQESLQAIQQKKGNPRVIHGNANTIITHLDDLIFTSGD